MWETTGERDEAGLAGAQGDQEERGLEGDQGDLLAGWVAAWAAARRATEDGGDDSIPEEESEDLARAQEIIDDTDITKAIYQIDNELARVQNPEELSEIGNQLGLTTGCVMDLTTGWEFTTK